MFFSSSLVFYVVSQGHIRRMGRIKDKKETSVKLVHFVMIYSTGEAFRSKGIHPHNVLGFCGWSLPWTCINLWPPAMDYRLQVSKAAMMINAYVSMHLDMFSSMSYSFIYLYMSHYVSYLSLSHDVSLHNNTLFRLHTV